MTMTIERPLVLVGVAEAAEILDMKRSNVSKFLEKRIAPYAERQAGSTRSTLWRREDVERARDEYRSDSEKLDADERRRAAARGERPPKPRRSGPRIALGGTQRRALLLLADGPCSATSEDGQSLRLALLRLSDRGLVRSLGGRPRRYELTSAGRRALADLNEDEES